MTGKLLNFDIFYLNLFIFLLPITLITGSALPDISITIYSLFFIFIYIFSIKKENFSYINVFFLFLIFYFYLIINSLIHYDNFLHAITKSVPYIRIIIFIFALKYLFSKHDLYGKIVTLSILFVITDIFIQFTLGKDIFGYPAYQSAGRLAGPFGDELKAGGYIARCFPILLSTIYLINKNFLLRFFIILITFFVIIITGERTALILIFLVTIFHFYLFNEFKKFLFTLPFILIIFGALVLSNQNIKERFIDASLNSIYQNISYDSNSDIRHFFDSQWGAHYLTSYKMIKENPILGIGIKNFRNVCNDDKYSTFSKSDYKRCSTHPHNYYIEIITELGLIGFIIVCFLFIVIFYHFKIIFISLSNKKKIIFFGYLNCILINLWPLIPSGSFFNNWNSIIFWLPIGLIYSLWNKKIE